ncbi:hypothetical protein [Nocardiopsis ganjiahuensis]|uniref:hypothetical protein n=1 Tax=Nocardiopsis ganjiahuensis TaxID=239984 RepID=UPI0007C7C474|nr:hypothetical protein [Nocardiopsis ganjiahuensis]
MELRDGTADHPYRFPLNPLGLSLDLTGPVGGGVDLSVGLDPFDLHDERVIVDVEFPAAFPSFDPHSVGRHWSHPPGRHFMRLMVSATTPGEMSP